MLFQSNGWVVCVASMSLGAVAGFLSMLPGGAFARELASTWILSTLLPQPIALLGTVVSRLTSLASEAIAIGGSKAIQLWWSSSGQRSSDRIRAEGMRVDRDDATDG